MRELKGQECGERNSACVLACSMISGGSFVKNDMLQDPCQVNEKFQEE